jgi:twitching motility protein PilJ
MLRGDKKMAITFPSFNLKVNQHKKIAGEPQHTTLIMNGLRKITAKAPGMVPVIGHLPLEKQYSITLGGGLALVVLSAGLLIYNTIQVGHKVGYVGTATEMQMLSQRIAKNAGLALLGSPDAFKSLKESEMRYGTDLDGLKQQHTGFTRFDTAAAVHHRWQLETDFGTNQDHPGTAKRAGQLA